MTPIDKDNIVSDGLERVADAARFLGTSRSSVRSGPEPRPLPAVHVRTGPGRPGLPPAPPPPARSTPGIPGSRPAAAKAASSHSVPTNPGAKAASQPAPTTCDRNVTKHPVRLVGSDVVPASGQNRSFRGLRRVSRRALSNPDGDGSEHSERATVHAPVPSALGRGTTVMPGKIDAYCALDYRDAPHLFEPDGEPLSPPHHMRWWQGWWPCGGVPSLDDLRSWVSFQLDVMIGMQGGDETLADIGLGFGIQALENADRYLGRFGRGDHPPRPPARQLRHVEDVEDALEGLLRYLAPQAQSAGASGPPTPPSVAAQGKQQPAKRSWTQPALDRAIGEYIAERAAVVKSLRKAIEDRQRGAMQQAQKRFGRNAIARALGVKARAMVSKSPAWVDLADDLGLPRTSRRVEHRPYPRSGKIGYDVAVERKSLEQADPVGAEVEQREAIARLGGAVTQKAASAYVRKYLKGREAEAMIEAIQKGETPPEKVPDIVEALLQGREYDPHRRKRH